MSVSSKHILLLISGVLILIALTACESMGKKEAPESEVVVTNRLDSVPGVQPVPSFPVPTDNDLTIMTSKLSGGSVEIYDLDSGVTQPAAPLAPVTSIQQPVGMASAIDPNVTIYPLDGSGTDFLNPPSSPMGMPAMALAEPVWPNALLPVNGRDLMRLTPPPGSMDPVGSHVPFAGKTLAQIYFAYGSSYLDGRARNTLLEVAEQAKFAPVDRVHVEGHASFRTQTNDPIKARILNLKESMNRAYAVSEELIQQGVPAEKIQAIGWGDTKPEGKDEAGQRRVDISVGGQ